MSFDESLEQIIALLQRQGCVSYRALKMRLDIDDEYLEVLKEELLFAYPVIEEPGRGLVWTEGTAGLQTPAPPPIHNRPPSPAQETLPPQAASQPSEPHAPDAERRQLTVMFCDFVGSTALSGELDPEDFRNVIHDYQQVCSAVVRRFDGYIAQYLGDGLLVYFGFPTAHEDDAQRAVHAGLGILQAIQALNARLKQTRQVELAVQRPCSMRWRWVVDGLL